MFRLKQIFFFSTVLLFSNQAFAITAIGLEYGESHLQYSDSSMGSSFSSIAEISVGVFRNNWFANFDAWSNIIGPDQSSGVGMTDPASRGALESNFNSNYSRYADKMSLGYKFYDFLSIYGGYRLYSQRYGGYMVQYYGAGPFVGTSLSYKKDRQAFSLILQDGKQNIDLHTKFNGQNFHNSTIATYHTVGFTYTYKLQQNAFIFGFRQETMSYPFNNANVGLSKPLSSFNTHEFISHIGMLFLF